MLRKIVLKIVGVAGMLAFTLLFSRAAASDILLFVDIPAAPDVQASMEIIHACRNGVVFGFHAMDRQALVNDARRNWDISFAPTGRDLLFKEHPLWLTETTPLTRDDRVLPYGGYFTLRWDEPVAPGPLTTCLAGAGTGFCEFPIEIDDCELDPVLSLDIAQVGPGDTRAIRNGRLVFEVRAYDPRVGTNNGDGIDAVTMQVIDPVAGSTVFAYTQNVAPAGNTDEDTLRFCAFSDVCVPWDFANHDYAWPDGTPVRSGIYLLRATASTAGRAVMTEQVEAQIDIPPQVDAVLVPTGEFTMGSSAGNRNEQPIQTVDLGDFWISRTEVTYGQYAQCVRAYACSKPHDDPRWNDPAFEDFPVTNVNWRQASDYAAWVGGRLPTEAEWEKSCRGTDGRTYPWGEEIATTDLANFDNEIGTSMPVGSYPAGASPYDVLDLSGNVWEWTSSGYEEYPYVADDGREDANTTPLRSVRGGSYYYTRFQLTCAARTHFTTDVVSPQLGFRVVFDQGPHETTQSVRFAEPVDGATVTSPVEIVMEATGLTVEPAGERHPNAGHFHILVDADFLPPGELIPFDERHVHFGQGQLTTSLDLAPGQHTLRLQFADGAHQAQEGDQYRDEITITVTGE